MDRIGGGFPSYQALRADARAYDDVLLVMRAEAEAAKRVDQERRMGEERR